MQHIAQMLYRLGGMLANAGYSPALVMRVWRMADRFANL